MASLTEATQDLKSTLSGFMRSPRGRRAAYAVVYLLCVIGALWQNAHPLFTLLVMLLIVLNIGSAFIEPCPAERNARATIGRLVLGVSVLWMLVRFAARIPPEVALIEGLAGMGFCLSLSEEPKHGNYLMLASFTMLIFGSVGPPRVIFVLVLPLVVPMLMWTLYKTREPAIAGTERLRKVGDAKPTAWFPRAGHFIGVGLLWIILFSLLPIHNPLHLQQNNFISPSQRRKRQPRTLMEWLFPKRRQGTSGTVTPDSSDPVDGQRGHLGNELVMTVRSPIPMYWVGAIYDVYDGEKWSASKRMKHQMLTFKSRDYYSFAHFEQAFTIEKWFSPVLYSCYLRGGRAYGLSSPAVSRDRSFYRETLRPGQAYPPLPFRYQVKSYLPGTEDCALNHWYETLPQRHYTKLRKISKRVYNYAFSITKDQDTDYAKAIAIRNHLRSNFEYMLQTDPAPAGREQVDYFLFDLKKGHCEYFSAAMTVLARCVGLPARVVTGFAPGDYNGMTGEFDVYEYHAHAWAQVFIDGKGWLTMDATPGGAEQLRPKSSLTSIGTWRNPFSDDWRVRAPELSSNVQRMLNWAREARERFLPGQSWLVRLLTPGATAPMAHVPINPSEMKAAARRRSQPRGLFFTAKYVFLDWVEHVKEKIMSMDFKFMINCLVFCIMLIMIANVIPVLFETQILKMRVNRQAQIIAKAENNKSPEETVRICYQTIRKLLNIGRLPRVPGEELMSYAANLHNVDIGLSRNLVAVFAAYNRLAYSPNPPTERDARQVISQAEEAESYLSSWILTGRMNLWLAEQQQQSKNANSNPNV